MLEYYRIDIAEEIDVNKTSASKECDFCFFWYFKNIGFKYDTDLCICYHDLMQKAMSFNDVAIVAIEMLTEFTFGILTKMVQLA